MLSFVKFVLVLTLALQCHQCQGFCGEEDHYTKVPKVTVAHLKVSWHGLFSGCLKSEVLKMGVSCVISHLTPRMTKYN